MYTVPTSPFEFGGVWQGGLVVADTLLGHWDPITENDIQRALAHSIVVNSAPGARGVGADARNNSWEVGALFV